MSGRSKEASTKLVVVCRQRPLCQCPTINGGRAKLAVWVRQQDTVGDLKLAIQGQLNRGNSTNALLLDPARQIIYDPTEGHQLQVSAQPLNAELSEVEGAITFFFLFPLLMHLETHLAGGGEEAECLFVNVTLYAIISAGQYATWICARAGVALGACSPGAAPAFGAAAVGQVLPACAYSDTNGGERRPRPPHPRRQSRD